MGVIVVVVAVVIIVTIVIIPMKVMRDRKIEEVHV